MTDFGRFLFLLAIFMMGGIVGRVVEHNFGKTGELLKECETRRDFAERLFLEEKQSHKIDATLKPGTECTSGSQSE